MELANNMLAFAALVISLSLFIRTRKNMKLQEEHFKKCLQPFCNIRCIDFNNFIKIELHNVGLGYLVIDKITIRNKVTKKEYLTLFEIFPENIKLSYYSVDIIGSGISANKYITLIKIASVQDEDRELIRGILKEYEIEVQYSDVYGINYSTKKELHFLYGKTHRK